MICKTLCASAQQRPASALQGFDSLTCEAASALSAPTGDAAIAWAAAASKLPLGHIVSVQGASRRLGLFAHDYCVHCAHSCIMLTLL